MVVFFFCFLKRRCCTASKIMRMCNRGRSGAEKKEFFQTVRQTQSLERHELLSSKAAVTVVLSIGDVW